MESFGFFIETFSLDFFSFFAQRLCGHFLLDGDRGFLISYFHIIDGRLFRKKIAEVTSVFTIEFVNEILTGTASVFGIEESVVSFTQFSLFFNVFLDEALYSTRGLGGTSGEFIDTDGNTGYKGSDDAERIQFQYTE